MSRGLRRAWPCALLLALGCNDGGPVRPWKASDHEQPPRAAVDPRRPTETAGEAAPAAPNGIPTEALRTWAMSCTRCHGIIGGGDGPERNDLPVPNFTSPTWQQSRDDGQLQASIVHGKGKMPAFPTLERDSAGLVRLIRMMGSQGSPDPSAAPQASGASEAVPPPATAQPSGQP